MPDNDRRLEREAVIKELNALADEHELSKIRHRAPGKEVKQLFETLADTVEDLAALKALADTWNDKGGTAVDTSILLSSGCCLCVLVNQQHRVC